MPFAEDAAVSRRKRDADCPAVLEAQCQRPADQRDIGDFVVGGAFDPMQSGDRHAGADQHALIARDRVADSPQDCSILIQFADSGELLDDFESRVLHIAILLARPRPRTRGISRGAQEVLRFANEERR